MFFLPLLLALSPLALMALTIRFTPSKVRLRTFAILYFCICAIGVLTPWLATIAAASEMVHNSVVMEGSSGCATAAVGFIGIGYIFTVITLIICLGSLVSKANAKGFYSSLNK